MPEILCVGLTTVDVTYQLTAQAAAGKKTQAQGATLAFGGPAANAAAAAATLGSDVTLCTTFGQGPLSEFAVAELGAAEVKLVAAESTGQLPISCVTLTPDGGRTVVSANGIGVSPTPPTELAAIASASKVVLVDGYYPDLAMSALTNARAAGATTVIDLGSWKHALTRLLPACTVAIASADFTVPTPDLFEYLLAAGPEFVAVTDGGRDITWQDSSGNSGRIAVPQVAAIDSNGAGDILHGAFASLLAVHGDIVECLTQAAAIASASCTVLGARIPAPAAANLGRRQ